MADLRSLSRACRIRWVRGLTIAEDEHRAPIASAYPLIVEGACDHRIRLQNGVMEAMACASSTEAFSDVLATIVRADEVVAMDPEGTPVG
jgi:hypothetical protein